MLPRVFEASELPEVESRRGGLHPNIHGIDHAVSDAISRHYQPVYLARSHGLAEHAEAFAAARRRVAANRRSLGRLHAHSVAERRPQSRFRRSARSCRRWQTPERWRFADLLPEAR